MVGYIILLHQSLLGILIPIPAQLVYRKPSYLTMRSLKMNEWQFHYIAMILWAILLDIAHSNDRSLEGPTVILVVHLVFGFYYYIKDEG